MAYYLVSFLFCCILLYMIVHFVYILNMGDDPKKSSKINNKLYIEEKKDLNIKRDCATTIRYCTNNFDCANFCEPSPSFNIKNVCDSATKICTPTAVGYVDKCDNKKGFLDSYVQTELDGFWKCLNTKPYFFDEEQNLLGYVCSSGGKVAYDFHENVQLSCVCADGFVKAFNINKPSIPVCVQREKLKILSSFIEEPETP